jgi:VWFA-related protein
MRQLLTIIVCLGLLLCNLLCERNSLAQQGTPTFRVQTTLVVVPFHVERGGHYVADLKPEDILLLEDGKPVNVTCLEGGASARETMPIEIMILFDATRLEGTKIDQLYAFIEGFNSQLIESSLLEGSAATRFSIFCLQSEKLWRMTGLTRDSKQIAHAFQSLLTPGPPAQSMDLPLSRITVPTGQFGSWYYKSRIYDALIAVPRNSTSKIDENSKRILMVFSMGLSGTGTRSEDVINAAEQSGIPIYPVVWGEIQVGKVNAEWGGSSSGRSPNPGNPANYVASGTARMLEDMKKFTDLGERTGGLSFTYAYGSVNLSAMQKILATMRSHTDSQYFAGFMPSQSGAKPKQHHLEVKLVSKGVGKLIGGKRQASY